MYDIPEIAATLLGVFTGLGLAAACGFRVFVPMLVASLAVRADLIDVHTDFLWLESTPVLIALVLATLLEIAAYYLPFVDNLLDTVATPAAAVAGATLACAFFVDLDPWLRWSLGIIAGGGLATAVQVPTAATRAASSVSTAGVGNVGVATGETLGASLLAGLSVFTPVVVPMVLIALLVSVVHLKRKLRRRG